MNIKKLAKRIITVLVSAAVGFTAISAAGTVIMFNIIFKRPVDEPKKALLSYSDIESEKYPREQVSFESDGNHLCGYLYTDKNTEEKGTVIIVNGIKDGADSHMPEIMYFMDNGWRVFTYDSTAIGNSEGDTMNGLPQMKLDLICAIEYLKKTEAFDLPVVLYGHSIGGYSAVTAAKDENDICAVVSVGGFDSVNDTMIYHAKRYTGFLADIESPFLRLYNRILFGEDADIKARDVLEDTEVPMMIINIENDRVVPYEISIGRYRNEIKKDNLKFYTVKAYGDNAHSSAWLLPSAAEYRDENRDSESIDKFRANELNPEYMEKILDFYNSEAEKR